MSPAVFLAALLFQQHAKRLQTATGFAERHLKSLEFSFFARPRFGLIPGEHRPTLSFPVDEIKFLMDPV